MASLNANKGNASTTSSLTARKAPAHFETLPFLDRSRPGAIEGAYIESKLMPAVRKSLSAVLERMADRPLASVIQHLKDFGDHSGRSEPGVELPVLFDPSRLNLPDQQQDAQHPRATNPALRNGAGSHSPAPYSTGVPSGANFSASPSSPTAVAAQAQQPAVMPMLPGAPVMTSVHGSPQEQHHHNPPLTPQDSFELRRPSIAASQMAGLLGSSQRTSMVLQSTVAAAPNAPPPGPVIPPVPTLSDVVASIAHSGLPALKQPDTLRFQGRSCAMSNIPQRSHVPHRFIKAGEHPVYACDVPALSHLPGLLHHMLADECIGHLHVVVCGLGDVQCFIQGKPYRATPTAAQWWSAVSEHHRTHFVDPIAAIRAAARAGANKSGGGGPAVGADSKSYLYGGSSSGAASGGGMVSSAATGSEATGTSPPGTAPPPPPPGAWTNANPTNLTHPSQYAEVEELLLSRVRSATKQFAAASIEAAQKLGPSQFLRSAPGGAGASGSTDASQGSQGSVVGDSAPGGSGGGGKGVSILTPATIEELTLLTATHRIAPRPEYVTVPPKSIVSVTQALKDAGAAVKGLEVAVTRLQCPDDVLCSTTCYDEIFSICDAFITEQSKIKLLHQALVSSQSPTTSALTPATTPSAAQTPNHAAAAAECGLLIVTVDRWQLLQQVQSVFALYFTVLRDVEVLKRNAQLAESVVGRNSFEFADEVGKKILERRKRRDERRDALIRAQLAYYVENRQDEPPDFMEKRGAIRNARHVRRRREDERRREVEAFQDSNAATKIQSMLRSLIARRRQNGRLGGTSGQGGGAVSGSLFQKRKLAAQALDPDLQQRKYATGQFPIIDVVLRNLQDLFSSEHITTDKPRRNATKTIRNWIVSFHRIDPQDEWDVSSEEEEWSIENVDRVVTQFSASMNPLYLAAKALETVGADDIALMRDLHENYRAFPALQRKACTMLHRLGFQVIAASYLCFHLKRKVLSSIEEPLPLVLRTLKGHPKAQGVMSFEAFTVLAEPAFAPLINMHWLMPYLSRVPIYTPLSTAPTSTPPGRPLLKGLGVTHVILSGPRSKGAVISEERATTAFQQLFRRVPIFLVPDMLTADQWTEVAESIVKKTACRRIMWLSTRSDVMAFVNGVPMVYCARPDHAHCKDGSLLDPCAFRGVTVAIKPGGAGQSGALVGGGAAAGATGATSPAASAATTVAAPTSGMQRPGAAGKARGAAAAGGRHHGVEQNDIAIRSPTPSEMNDYEHRSNYSAASYSAYNRGSASDMHSAIVRHAANMGVHEHMGLQWEKIESDFAAELVELIEDDDAGGKLHTHIQRGHRDVDNRALISQIDTNICDRPAPVAIPAKKLFPTAAIMRADGPLRDFGVDPEDVVLTDDAVMEHFISMLPSLELASNLVPCIRPQQSKKPAAMVAATGAGADDVGTSFATSTPQDGDLVPRAGGGALAGGNEKVAQGAGRRGARAIARDRATTLGSRTTGGPSRATSSIGTQELTDEEAGLPLRATDVVRTPGQVGEEVRQKLRKATSLDNPLIFVRLPIPSCFTLQWLRTVDVLYLLSREIFADSHVVLTLGVAGTDSVFLGALCAVVYAVEFDKAGVLSGDSSNSLNGAAGSRGGGGGHGNHHLSSSSPHRLAAQNSGDDVSGAGGDFSDFPAEGEESTEYDAEGNPRQPPPPPPVSPYAAVCRLVALQPRLELQLSVAFVNRLLEQINCKGPLYDDIATHMQMAEACATHGQPGIAKWHALKATQLLERYVLLLLFHNFVKFVQEKRQVMSMMNVDFSFREHLVSLPSVMKLIDTLDPWEGKDRSNGLGPSVLSPFSQSAASSFRWRRSAWLETIG